MRTNRVFELLGSLRLAFQSGCLSLDNVDGSFACCDVSSVDTLRLKTIYDMLGCSHFNARMIALKELTYEMELSQETNYHKRQLVLPFNTLKDWLFKNSVLEKTMANLDNVHYSQKLKRLLLTLGDQVPVAEISRLWGLLSGQSSIAYDNVFALLATVAATKFNELQITHFFDLVRKSWSQDTSFRMRERLLKLIGSTGSEGKNHSQSRVSIRALELLWELCHLPDSSRKQIEVALDQHLSIVKENYYIKEHVKNEYITKCVEDVKKNTMTYFILNHLMSLLKILTKHQPGPRSEKNFLHEMNQKHDITRMIVTSLLQYEANAIQTHGNKLDANSPAQGGFTHRDYIQLHLDFLHYILQKAELFLIQTRAREIWKNLIGNPKASDFDREVCLDWFAKSISDLEIDTQNIIFTKDLFKLEASKIHNETGFRCFKAYFEKVNTNENKMKTAYTTANKKWYVEKTDLLGLDYLWKICLFTPSDVISQQAQEFLLEVTWTQVTGKPRKEPAAQHKKFFATCKKRLETAKKKVAEYRRERNKTGGGPEPTIEDIYQSIWDLVPNQFERIVNNPFDDDASLIPGDSLGEELTQIVNEDDKENHSESPTPKKRKIESTMISQCPLNLAEMKSKHMAEEHEMRLKLLRDEYEMKMKVLNVELEAARAKESYYKKKCDVLSSGKTTEL